VVVALYRPAGRRWGVTTPARATTSGRNYTSPKAKAARQLAPDRRHCCSAGTLTADRPAPDHWFSTNRCEARPSGRGCWRQPSAGPDVTWRSRAITRSRSGTPGPTKSWSSRPPIGRKGGEARSRGPDQAPGRAPGRQRLHPTYRVRAEAWQGLRHAEGLVVRVLGTPPSRAPDRRRVARGRGGQQQRQTAAPMSWLC
jgi:hypothetical protein